MVDWKIGAVSGIVGIIVIFSVVLNTTGVSYKTDGDKSCTDCYSEISVNSTFWEWCVEYAGPDKTALFAKDTASRRRWINLDKVNEIVTTNPEVHTDLLVKTTKSRAEFTSEEFGYLRNVKDGDCIIGRYSKANPNPSLFYIHGQKEANQRIKWSFELSNALGEDVSIDPIWLPIDSVKTLRRCENKSREITQDILCSYIESVVYYDNLSKVISYNDNVTLQRKCDEVKIVQEYRECEEIGISIKNKNYDLVKYDFKTWERKGNKIIAYSIYDGDSYCVIDATTGVIDSCKFDSKGKHMRKPSEE